MVETQNKIGQEKTVRTSAEDKAITFGMTGRCVRKVRMTKQKLSFFGAAALGCLAPLNAMAASFGDMADSVKSEMTKFGPLLQAGFALGGFFLVGLGLWQLWARSQQPGSPKGSAITAILIGCGLLGAATIAQMGAGTLGTGSPELNEIGL